MEQQKAKTVYSQKAKSIIHKISLYDYVPRWENIHFQFLFSSWAIDYLKHNPHAQMDYARSEEKKRYHSFKKKHNKSYNKDIEDRIQDVISKGSFSLANALNANRQNLIILQIAQFESFFNDIYRQILKYNLNLLRSDRQIPLGKVVNIGCEEIINQEITREVDLLNRKSLSDKLAHFVEKLEIKKKHIEGGTADDLDESIKLRNNILHESPDLTITEAQTEKAELSCLVLGINLFYNSWEKYPDIFRYP